MADRSEGNEARRRRSGEHEGQGEEYERRQSSASFHGAQDPSDAAETSARTTATDVPLSPRASIEGSPRVRFSTEVERGTTGKKRKSDEISREPASTSDSHGKPPALAIDTDAANASTSGNTVSSPTQSHTRTSPQSSPLSPRSRNRGMSLRSSLFHRNMDRKSPSGSPILEMQPLESPTVESSDIAKRDFQPTVTEDSLPDRFESHVSDRVPARGPIRLPSSNEQQLPTSKGLQGVSALPNYQQWVQKRAKQHLPVTRIKDTIRQARKYMQRIQEIPPSKDGRHIPVDPARKKRLIDERTNHPYINNYIKSSKYTPWNFVPRQLFAQFSKIANVYFLIVAILQMIPGLSTTGTYTTIIPLMFFVSVSMAKEGYEDLRRHRLDKVENNQEASVLHAYRPVTGSSKADSENEALDSPQERGPIHWASVKWQNLQVGDIVKLERDDAAPADLILIDSKGPKNVAYIETMALDGETNLKGKQPSSALMGACRTPEAITALVKTEIVVEGPNLDLYNLDGKLSFNGELSPLTNQEVIYRGSILRNTPEAIGVVIYSGEECKIRMNSTKNPRIKAPSLQAQVNRIVMILVLFVAFLGLFNSCGYQIWAKETERKAWYLSHGHVPFGPIIVSFIIMFNTLIPLSLYVSMEIIKVCQVLLLNDIDMYDEASDTPFEARTSTINEELGQVSYIFSDKTGTLTDNVMQFRKLSVAGTAWFHDTDLKNQPSEDMLMHKKRRAKGKGKRPVNQLSRKSTSLSMHAARTNSQLGKEDDGPRKSTASRTARSQPEMNTGEMIRYIQRRPHTAFAQKAKMMMLSMALCHTCLPERGEDDDEDDISYQASSPDELALIQAARDLGYLVLDREVSSLTIKTYPNGTNEAAVVERYEVLDVIEFSSQRKRMSVLVRFPDGRICVICKGADSMVMERLRLVDLANQKLAEIEKRVNQRRSIEAQEALRRKSSMVDRHGSISSLPRTSVAFSRPSIGRPSFAMLSSNRESVDAWLKDREQDVTTPIDARHYTPRPSMQIGRKSLARSEYASSLHSEMEEDALVEEALVLDESAVIGRCFQHVNDFACSGLRTLLYGYRFLNEQDYRSWKKVYIDATTSLVDRQNMIEAAGELIEQDLELGGATAIEDKLQKGVPETIDRLRRANIKMWMLTGDKRETAINIGHSCRLIKDYSSITVLDHEAGGVEQSIALAIVDINRGGVAHSVIIIDGRTLGMVQMDDSLNTLFLDLAILADSVICCRASPSQKAGLVHAIRRRVNRSVTLAIGDGANDIAMIQEAHVGIGITGKEGLQAARASDYSIAQFRFLNKLLLVHGRWNYVRTCKYVVATFWKEMVFYLTQALYQRWNGYTGTSLYEQWSLSMFNTLFTSLPVIFLGIFEKDLAPSTLIAVPELYTKGQRSAGFNFRVYFSWVFMAASEAMIVFFTMKGLFGDALFTRSGQDLFAMGNMTFTACIIFINLKLQVLEQRNRTFMAAICLCVEIGGWFLWNCAFSLIYKNNYVYNVKGGLLYRYGQNVLWWLTLIMAIASCLLFEIIVRTLKNLFFPTDVETFQQLEGDLSIKRRFEEASASELQAGWNHGTKKSSIELQREAEQAQREGEIQDLLDRPRVMEEGKADGGRKKSGVVEVAERSDDRDEMPIRRSNDIHEMLSLRFGSVRRESLARA